MFPKHISRLILFLLISTVAGSGHTLAQETFADLNQARKYFAEMEALCRKDHAQLWGVNLCGPTLLVDPTTRAVVSNHADAARVLTPKEDLFVGAWPVEMNISNTALDWGGMKWTMIMWPLPSDPQERSQLMIHELFHRVQHELGLPGSSPANNHLDTQDGRVWLQLEWRALAGALFEQGPARKKAIRDALLFRAYRRSLFPQAAAEEKGLELNEGLAEYTGMKLSAGSNAEFALRAGCALRQGRFRPTFVRSFAYASGPAYGSLLDLSGNNWRRGLGPDADLGILLAKAYSIKPPIASRELALAQAIPYDGAALVASETEKANARQQLIAKYRARLVDQLTFNLPLSESVQYSFNPNNLIPFDETGTIYPTARVSDQWGILEVSDGALMIREGGRLARVVVAAPQDVNQRPLAGPGWKLELNEGWEIGPSPRKGSLVLQRKVTPR